jgi:hypothetical protein
LDLNIQRLLAKKGEQRRHKIKIELEAVAAAEILKVFPKQVFHPSVI